MIDGLRPYPAYKECLVPWVGKAPTHWDVKQLAHIGRFFKGNGGTKEDEAPVGVPCVRYGDLYTTHAFFIEQSRSHISADRQVDYTPIRYGDVLFAASGETIDEIGKSAVNLMQSTACCGGDVILFRPSAEVNPRFMGYATDCRPAASQKASMCRGTTIKHIYGEQLKRLTIALPPIVEQNAIVRFLGHADRRIRRSIRDKKKLIALQSEQKQAIIHTAVTRGLDPKVPLKPSSVAWLGDVPQHWRVTRLKFEASEIVDCLHATPRYVEAGDHPAIRTADIEAGRVRLAKARKVDEDEYLRWTSRLAPKPGDILYSREGERYGIAALVPDGVALCISQRMMIFRIASRHSSAFIMWQLNSRQVYDQAAADQIGATAPHINVDRIKNYWLTLPPVDEQVAIARHIEDRCRSLEASIERIEQESALIREYRVRLIADVVTGKLDVREAAATLPTESEPDPIDDVLTDVDAEDDVKEIVEGAEV